MNRYAGKRFAGFLITSGLLAVGLVWGNPDNYSAFAAALGLAYGAYLGGQTVTDHKALQ